MISINVSDGYATPRFSLTVPDGWQEAEKQGFFLGQTLSARPKMN